MDRGSEAARTTTAGSAELGMAGALRGSAANIGSGAFDGQLAAAPGSFSDFDLSAVAGHGEVPVDVLSHLHQEPGPDGVAYPNDIGAASWRHLGPVHVVLVGPQLPGGFVPAHGNYGYYSALQPPPGLAGARRGVVLGDLVAGGGGGAVYDWDYALLPRPDAGQGESFVGQFPVPGGGVDAAYDEYAYYALQPRPGAGHGEVLVGQLPDGAGHGDMWQPRPDAGRGEVLLGPLPDGVGPVFVNSGNFGQQTLLGSGRADEIAGALRDPDLGAGYDGSGALADDLGAVYNNRGMVSQHLRRLLPFVGIGASSVAVNGLAAGPGSPAIAFQLFVLLLGGLFLVTLHVLRV